MAWLLFLTQPALLQNDFKYVFYVDLLLIHHRALNQIVSEGIWTMLDVKHRFLLGYCCSLVCFSRPNSSNSFEGLLFGDASCLGPDEETEVWQVRELQWLGSKVFILTCRDLLSSQTTRYQQHLLSYFAVLRIRLRSKYVHTGSLMFILVLILAKRLHSEHKEE